MQYLTNGFKRRFAVSLAGLLYVCASLSARAAESFWEKDWYWHAFVSQGLVYTSDNNFAGSSDDSVSADFRELGLILGGALVEDVQLVAQILSRKMGEMHDGSPQLDYGFLNYEFLAGWDRSLGIKVGRIRSPLGFFNETRDAAQTRTSIILPQSIYMDRVRNLVFSRDGVQLFGSYQLGASLLNWDLVFAEVQVDKEQLPEVMGGRSLVGEVDAPFLPMARVIWDWDAGRTRLGLTYHPLEYRYKAGAADYYRNGSVEFENWILSAEYNTANWSLIGEYNWSRTRLDGMLDTLPPNTSYHSKTRSYYVQGIYRFAPGWDGFLRYDEERILFDSSLFTGMHTRDVALGVGWSPSPSWLLRTEWHWVDGDSWLSVRENPKGIRTQRWQMLLFQVSYRI